MIIYKITNNLNGKIYIGQTIGSLESRWQAHQKKTSGCLALRAAIEKYGVENFTACEIERCKSKDELLKREVHYIQTLDTLAPNGYNLALGDLFKGLTQAQKDKIANTNIKKGIKWPSRKGATLTQEHKDAISKKLTGRIRKPESVEKFLKTINSRPHHNGVPVVCNETGVVYESKSQAAKDTGLPYGYIGRCCNGTQSLKNIQKYTFSFVNQRI